MDNPAFTDVTNYSASNGISNGTSDGTSGTGHKEANGSLPHTKAKSRLNCLARARNKLICSLEMIFYRVGKVIAHHPVLTIILAVIPPLLLSIGIIKFQFNTDFAELLLPPSSRIFEDRAWVRSHVTYEQRVIRLILKNDNVLSKESLVGLYHLHEEILSLTAKDNHTMESMCVRLLNKCFVDSLLALWKNDLSVIETLTDQSIIDTINTVKFNPTYLFAFNASRLLGLMERNSSGHIVSAGVMHADWLIQSSEQLHRRAKELEYAAINIVRFGNHPVFHRVNIFTVDSYGEEFFGGVYGDTILIVYWFPVVALYIVMALGKLNLLEHGVYLAIGAILGVALSTGACFGIGMAAGFLFGAPHQALVFLLLAVGVDDAFVILTTWERVNKRHLHKPIEERVALTMQHAGVSVTVTSFTNLVAFASGVTTQMPVLQSFCVYCSFGILFCFLMQSTVFPACLTLNARRVEARRDALIPCIQYTADNKWMVPACSQKNVIHAIIKRVLAPAILSKVGMVFVIVITIVLAGVMAKGVSTMKKGYELEKSLPEDSYTRAFLESQRLYFTAEGPGIQTFCGPMDYHKNLPIIDHMAKKYANSSVIMYGLVANWIPTFKTYVGLFHMFEPKNEAGFPADEDKFYVLLKKFIENPMGASFSKYIEFTDDPVPRIKWTYFPMQQIVSQDVWENEHIMEVVRKIADDTTAELNGDGKCFCYSVFHIFTEVIRYVEDEIIRNFALAGVAIFLTTFLLIVDLLTSFLVLVCVALTTVNIMGTLQYWGFYLDVNLVVLLIISIGMAVDYSAHIGYTFMTLTGTRKERASNTLRQIGPAVWHGAASTFLVFFVLIFGRSLSSFFAVFIMVVIYGLWQGIFFLPVVLALIGPSPYFNAGPEGTVTSAYLPNLELHILPDDGERKTSLNNVHANFALDTTHIQYGTIQRASEISRIARDSSTANGNKPEASTHM